LTHRLADSPGSGPIISIKLSPSLATLSVQRSVNSVSFIPVTGASPASGDLEYSQAARAKACSVLGFVWLSNSDLVFVTDGGIELYTVHQDKRTVKYSRSVSEPVCWYSHRSGPVLVTSPSQETDSVTVWCVRAGSIVKLAALSLPCKVKDKDVRLVSIYEGFYLSVVVGDTREINLYCIKNDTVSLSHVLSEVDTGGVMDIHTIDNVILVHNQSMSRSKLYDLQLASPDPQLCCPALPPTQLTSLDGAAVSYSPNWVVFLPNILVDARNGKMMAVTMKVSSSNLPDIQNLGDSELLRLVRFLLNRELGKAPLIQVLRASVAARRSLATLQEMFRAIVTAYTCHQQHVTASCLEISCSSRKASVVTPGQSLGCPPAVVLDQPDIFTQVLNTFTSTTEVPDTFLLSVTVEYIHSLVQDNITPRQFVYELLINLCVKTNKLYQLQQLLQHGAISDSKPVACLLLSLASVYPSSQQVALDMMSRLGTATQEIIEILLARGQVISALNYVTANGGADSASARKFLEAAEATEDKMVFFNVYSFFEERNLRLRGGPGFSPGDQCEHFVRKYGDMFPA